MHSSEGGEDACLSRPLSLADCCSSQQAHWSQSFSEPAQIQRTGDCAEAVSRPLMPVAAFQYVHYGSANLW